MKDAEFGIWASMEARPGKEAAAREFLTEAAERLCAEKGTLHFFAMDLGERQFAIFNVFEDAVAVDAHVNGRTAQWVVEQREDLFVSEYDISKAKMIATKSAFANQASE